jgi:shikimate kinase
MLKGIIIMGLNGCGKSTICRELAELLNYRRMDVEDYYFLDSDIPYTNSRTHECTFIIN